MTEARSLRNPYPGLRPFRTDEEHLFFGREQQVDRMIDKLAGQRFLAVVGTSGSGKSSLVNCGLRPALHRGRMAGAGAAWRMAQMRPGSDPIAALAEALARPGVLYDAATLAEMADGSLPAEKLVALTLRLGSLGLVDMVEQARLPAGTRLLVVADQFEELFRYRSAARDGTRHGAGEEATAFVQLLLEAVAQTEVPIHVVLTMRSDYLGDCAQFHGLPELMNESQYLVPRLTRSEIRAAITGPASLSGAQISPVLLTRLLNDVGDNPDQLSILQHALNRTWAHWANEGGGAGALALADYEAIGGMREALDRHAEKAYAELADGDPRAAAGQPSRRQQLAARLFKAITDKGTDARGIRRPTPMAELCAICDAPAAELEPVLAVFRKASRSFLMPPEGEPLQPGTRVDISHESLMRVWHRLDRWADEEAAAARQLRRLADSAEMQQRLYGADGQSADGLLSDREVDLALDWLHLSQPNAAWAGQYGGRFALVDGFIARSRQHRLAGRVNAEIDLRWRTRGRLMVLAGVGLLFIVLNIVLTSKISEWLTGTLTARASGLGVDIDTGNFLIGLLSHVLVGLPALLLYDLLEPRLRAWHARRSRPAIEAEMAAADVAPAQAKAVAAEAAEQARAAAAAAAATASPTRQAASPQQPVAAWRRLLAAVVDLTVALFLMFVIALPGLISTGDVLWILGLFVLMPCAVCLVSARSLSSARQATLGKRLLGLQVTDRQGQRLRFGRACARQAVKLLSIVCFPLVLVGWLPVLLSRHQRALPDWVAGTQVRRRQEAAGA